MTNENTCDLYEDVVNQLEAYFAILSSKEVALNIVKYLMDDKDFLNFIEKELILIQINFIFTARKRNLPGKSPEIMPKAG